MIACLGLFICFVFMCTTYYLSKTSYIDYKLWDVFTVTAADFTVEYEITKALWDRFLLSGSVIPGEVKAVAFEAFLKEEIEKIVSSEEGVLSNDEEEIKIANISFAFDNCQLVSMLKTRGAFVA